MNLKIEKAAQKILDEFEIKSNPVPIEDIINRLDIVLSHASSDKYSGILIRKTNDVVLMGLNSLESYNRQRFTMAHELGHYYLHDSKNTFVDNKITVDYRDNKVSEINNKKEREANGFAAALLMPRDSIEKDFKTIIKEKKIFIEDHLIALANSYEVSKEAMKYRLINLGLIKI